MFNSLVLTRSQMKDLDRLASGGNSETGFNYMLKAGFGAAKILELKWGPFDGDTVTIVVGKGNNGGDGLITALQLKELGAQVKVLLLTHPENFRAEALMAWNHYLESGLAWSIWEGGEVNWEESDILIDAILGLGVQGEIRDEYTSLIKSMQEASDEGTYLYSLDIPTGSLEADACAIFGFTRWEAIDPETAAPFGEVGVVDLEYPEALIREVVGMGEGAKILDPQWYIPFLPLRDRFGDKRAHGTGLLVAGGPGMGGAAILSGLGALRLGLGYLKVACDPNERVLVQSELIEAPFVDWTQVGLDQDEVNSERLLEFWEEYDSLVMGPGLGLESDTKTRVYHWYKDFPRTAVIDADAINAFKGREELLSEHTGARIFTPHQREFERVFGELPDDLHGRAKRVRECAMKYRIEILLKGPVSIVASSKGEVSLYNQGSSALARAGSGDILSGILLALCSRWLAPELAYSTLCLGVWLHGMAAEIAKEEHSEISMRSAEIPNFLGTAVETLLNMMTQEAVEYGEALDESLLSDEEQFGDSHQFGQDDLGEGDEGFNDFGDYLDLDE